jgi:D-tyrosyl-tRNA(Tyr) deacylase
MRTIIQRVSGASVTVGGVATAVIQKGLLILISIEAGDTAEDITWLSGKIVNLRIFNDENDADNNGHSDISVKDIDGEILVVSQFTLHASTTKGNRPSYIKASKSGIAIPIYEKFIIQLSKDFGKKIQTGIFGADMKVALINDGPVTIWIDTKNRE